MIATVAAAQIQPKELHRLTPPAMWSLGVGVGDFDGDGDPDLAWLTFVGSVAFQYVQLGRNDGQGRFQAFGAPMPVATTLSAGVLEFGDIDGDGDQDLAMGARSSLTSSTLATPTAALFRNDGPLGFTNITNQWPTGVEWPSRVRFLDWDGDGDLDILTCNGAVASHHAPPVPLPSSRLYSNSGTGVFTYSGWMPYGVRPDTSVAFGDIDGDGDLDLVFGFAPVGALPGGVRVHLQNASHFAVEVPGVVSLPPLLSSVSDVALFDQDLDGDLDLAVATSQGVFFFTNNGSGAFTQSGSVPGSHWMRLYPGDFDLDGRTDLLGAGIQQFGAPVFYANTVTGFVDVTATHFEAAGIAPKFLSVFDADRDGDLDVFWNGYSESAFWFNDGQGHLLDTIGYPLTNSLVLQAAAGDADGDSDLDVAIIEGPTDYSTQVAYSRNDGDGPGADKVVLVPWNAAYTSCLAWIDADLDGDQDLMVGGSPHRLFHSIGGQLVDVTATHWPATALTSESITVADFDGDGVSDVFVGAYIGDARLFRGDGVGGYVDASSVVPAAVTAKSAVALDYDTDGDPDLVLAGGSLRILRNDWPAAFVDATATLGLSGVTATCVAPIDVDRDGARDVVLTGSISGNGVGILRATGATLVDETAARVPAGLLGLHRVGVADVDGDGWDDVCVQGVSVSSTPSGIRNVNGVFVMPPVNIAATVSPSSADFDGDGDVDVVLGSGLRRNRTRQLQNAVPPRLGFAAELVVHAYGGNGVDLQAALLLLSPQTAPAPIATSFGTLFLDPAVASYHSTHLIAGTGGEATIPYTVPSSPSVLGSAVFAQAAFVHTPDPATWRLGNVLELRVRL